MCANDRGRERDKKNEKKTYQTGNPETGEEIKFIEYVKHLSMLWEIHYER
jgi:hypothetical protein